MNTLHIISKLAKYEQPYTWTHKTLNIHKQELRLHIALHSSNSKSRHTLRNSSYISLNNCLIHFNSFLVFHCLAVKLFLKLVSIWWIVRTFSHSPLPHKTWVPDSWLAYIQEILTNHVYNKANLLLKLITIFTM